MGGQKTLSKGELLNENGELNEAGYHTSLVKAYDRSKVKVSKLRLKEWDYYLISNGSAALALTIADNGYMGLTSFSLLDFAQREEKTLSKMNFFPMGKIGLPATSERGDVSIERKGYFMTFRNDGKVRRLNGRCEKFLNGETLEFSLSLTNVPRDSMVIATPFSKNKRAFYYNQKINCLVASGEARLGNRVIVFDDSDTLAVLDWGRGVWTYDNTWLWSSASGYVSGKRFGFNVGYGFGDTSAASENMLFYDGVAHKLTEVTFHIPKKDGKDDFLSPWRFSSVDGRFEMAFEPILDRASLTDFKLLCSDQHQVFGYFTGEAMLDTGEKLKIDRLLGFAEKVRNKW